MKRLLGAVILLSAVGLAQAQARKPPPAEPPARAAPESAPEMEVGGLVWTAPREWEAQGARPMRAATYRVAPAKGDAEPAELAVFYFGPGQGGPAEANVKRWAAQFQKADGTPLTDKDVHTKKETVHGLTVTLVDIKGAYTGGGPMMGPSTPRPGSRLLGAIIEGPEAPLFFKLTGGERTVAGAEKGFRKLVESVQRK